MDAGNHWIAENALQTRNALQANVQHVRRWMPFAQAAFHAVQADASADAAVKN